MADQTKIEWTDGTWNAWWGCQKVGPGCDNCYAEALDRRTGGAHWGAKADRRRTSERNWNAPLRWQRQADAFETERGRRRRVFCGSMMDIMDNAVPLEWGQDAFARIEECDRIDWQLLTKRVGNVADRIPPHWQTAWPRHVGLMITVVNQDEADRDVPKLLDLKVRFRIPWVGLSMEPLLGPVDLTILEPGSGILNALTGRYLNMVGDGKVVEGPRLDWVIVGGESGPGARPMHPDWARRTRDACAEAGVAFHFKQWGDWAPHKPVAGDDLGGEVRAGRVTIAHPSGRDDVEIYRATGGRNTEPGSRYMRRVGKKAAGRLLDGVTHDGFPGVRS